MGCLRAVFSAVTIGLVLQLPVTAAAAVGQSGQWQWPLSPDPVVAAAFRAPVQPWGPGHRGVDLLGSVGQPVSAIGAGTISFAGLVAGRGVVVVDHGALRSTYEPVLAHVRRGESVAAGQVIGTLEAVSSHCPPQACLHLGVRRGEEYLDPLTLLGPRQVRLKPLSGTALASGPAPGPTQMREGQFAGQGQPASGIPPASEGPPAENLTLTAGVTATAALVAAAAERRRRRRRVDERVA